MAKKTKTSYHHGDLRQALINAAITLISEKGPNSFSLREVAKRAGVSHTAPYRHFKDKDSLLSAIALIGFQLLADRLIEVQAQYTSDPLRQFMEAEKVYVEVAVENPEVSQLMFGGYIPQEHCVGELAEVSQSAFQQLFVIIENGQKANVLKQQDTMELSLAAWSMVHGLSSLINSGQLLGHVETQQEVENITIKLGRLLFEGLKETSS